MSEYTEMELRVALALAEFQYGCPQTDASEHHLAEARAAIRAMQKVPRCVRRVVSECVPDADTNYNRETRVFQRFWKAMFAELAKPE